MWIIKKLGSLHATVIISIFVIVLLIVSTFFESVYGTMAAQSMFYQTKWFDVMISLLWINIFCATVLRLPFKKKHTGFLLTHIGILGLLAGALISRIGGIEGQMVLVEQTSTNQISQGTYDLTVTSPNREDVIVTLPSKDQKIPVKEEGIDIEIKKIIPRASRKFAIKAGDDLRGENNYAIKLTVKSESLGMEESVELIEKHPNNSNSSESLSGPLKLMLTRGAMGSHSGQTVLRVLTEKGMEGALVHLDKPVKGRIPVIGTDLYIENIQYYERARVTGGKMTNVPEATINPAVEFDVYDAQGRKNHYVQFAYYPDFNTIHGKSGEAPFHLDIKFETPHRNPANMHPGPQLTFSVLPNKQWVYQMKTEDGTNPQKEVSLNTWTNTGWLDLKFRVDEIVPNATVVKEIIPSTDSRQGIFAVQLETRDLDKKYTQWIMEGQRLGLQSSQGTYYFELASRTREVPFTLFLKDFRKEVYPGTNRPAAFESDVTLYDKSNQVEISKTISMNNPLDYKGFRIFQSSFIQNPGSKDVSVFTVAKNPGILLIYISSFIIFIGAFLQFYVKKFNRM